MFQLGRVPTKENSTRFYIYHDGLNFVASRDTEDDPPLNQETETPYECVTFYLAPETGQLTRKLSDEMVVMDTRRNKTSVQTGSATMERIIGSVVWVDGLTDQKGNEIHRINERAHDAMPSWMIAAVSKRISQLNRDKEISEALEG